VHTNQIVEALSELESAIGYVGYVFDQEAKDTDDEVKDKAEE
jgi:ABC-type phosphate transport system substrate-binding protein